MSEVTPKPVSRKGSISDLKQPTGTQNSVLEWAWGSSVRKDPAGQFNRSSRWNWKVPAAVTEAEENKLPLGVIKMF